MMMTTNGEELYNAAEKGEKEHVEELLKRGVDVNWINPLNFGRTPLMAACLGGHMDVVIALLRAGADVPKKDVYGLTAIELAKPHHEIIQILSSPLEAPTTSTTATTTTKKGEIDANSIPFEELEIGGLPTDLLGSGGFATVYRGKWRGETVAVKILNSSEEASEDKMSKKFRKEANLMVKLQSPRLVHLFGVCHPPGPVCFVMEFMSRGL